MLGTEELRKASGELDYLASLLDSNEGWKTVMSFIPKETHSDNYLHNDHYERKFNDEHVRLIKDHAEREKLSYTKVLFDEWGSSGRVRPTLHTLMTILKKASMYRAADHLADILNIPHPPRPSEGPCAQVNVTDYLNNLTLEQNIVTRMLPNGVDEAMCHGPTKKLEQSHHLMHFPPSENISLNSVPVFVLNGENTIEILNNTLNAIEPSDLIEFTLSSSQYIPDFPELVKTESLQHINKSMSGSSLDSESSRTQSDILSQSEASLSINQNQMHTNLSYPWLEQVDKDILHDTELISFKYLDLEVITENFRHKAGSGGFGDIFKGNHRECGLLAVKRSHGMQMKPDLVMKIFNSEVISLSSLRHDNIVHIQGYSLDGPSPCIVCEYIEGGNLLDFLQTQENRRILNIPHRMKIMVGTAEGLKHIHSTEKPLSTLSELQDKTSSRKQYFVHGDVKSANILITRDFTPKICDLGLSKQCGTTFLTESIMGTRAYMSHERLSGTITPKGDTFSYGVVLLELLTGLPPEIICPDGTFDIKTYVEEICGDSTIASLIDQEIGEWPTAQRIYNLAKLCLKHNRNDRPTMNEICERLQEIVVMVNIHN